MTLELFSGDVHISFSEQGVSDLRLSVSYAHPARLSWRMHLPQQSLPLPFGALVTLIDSEFGDASTPIFEGHVHEISPAESQRVDYVAYDATRRAGQEITVLDGPHDNGTSAPRAVFNVKIDTDDDYAFAGLLDASVGQILEVVFQRALVELRPLLAAPASSPAYVASDLEPLSLKPQEKIVFESETLRAAIDQLLSFYPQYRMIFEPGPAARQWRIFDITQSPAITLILNQSSAGEVFPVLSLRLERSLEKRAPAVRIVGPAELRNGIAQVSAGTLTRIWDLQSELQFNQVGPTFPFTSQVGLAWQITDPAKRSLGRILPTGVYVPTNQVLLGTQSLTFLFTRRPTLLVSFDSGQSWNVVYEIVLDTNQGVVFTPAPIYEYDPIDRIYRLPSDVKLYYSHHAEPLSVRYPAEGFEGTAHSIAGQSFELKIHDESLAVSYERFAAATTPERVAEFSELAKNIHTAHKDIAYAGGATLDGIDYRFLRLNRRVNLSSVDANAAPLVTGWESMGAIVTDVEYDFAEQLTTLTFSGDLLEILGSSVDRMRRELKLEATTVRSPMVIRYDAPGFFEMTANIPIS